MSADCPCCGDPRPSVRWAELDVSLERGATCGGRGLRLSSQPLAILHLLTRRAPLPVSAEALALYLDSEADDGLGILRVQVCRLRRALQAAGWPVAVTTVWGHGYRLERIAGPS